MRHQQVNQVLPKYFANVHEVIGSVYDALGNEAHTPLIVDTGASCCVTPHKEDFVEGSYRESKVKIKDLSSTNKVAGKGLIRWRIKDSVGRVQVVEIEGFHMPKASVRLLSPQCLYHKFGGSGEQDHKQYSINISGGISFQALYNYANLPVLAVVEEATPIGLWSECFGFNSELRDAWAKGVLDERNQNLSLPQKELLLWHQRLSHFNLAAFTTSVAISVRRRPSLQMT
jgi:hypothetical protein